MLVLVLIAVVADIAVRLSMSAKPKQSSRCLAIPIRFLMEYPNCTNKLIQAANLTNIRIVPPGTLDLRRLKQSVLYNSNFLGSDQPDFIRKDGPIYSE